jgi:hypothetical protein
MAATPGSVAVVVPTHRARLDADDEISLRHLLRFLGGYDRYLVLPKSLSPPVDGFAVKRFPNRFFATHEGYTALLVSRRFYRSFAEYEYILLYQLDCLVFRDELAAWCARHYDYVGAMHRMADHPPMPGNGGFSLRRIPAFLDVLTSRARMVDPTAYWQRNWARAPPLTRLLNTPRRIAKQLHAFNGVQWEIRRQKTVRGWSEDWFWSLEAAKYVREFRIPTAEEGLRFGFSEEARSWFEAAEGALPFGCHAWNRGDDRAVWEPYLLRE